MNKVHRIIRDEALDRLVVDRGNASTRATSASTRRIRIRGIAAAVMALGAGQASAIPVCGGGPNYTIGLSLSVTCVMTGGKSLVVQGSGSIATSGGVPAVTVSGTVAGSITNAGGLTSTGGKAIAIGTNGSVTTIANSGSISGDIAGIHVTSSGRIAGGITNSGLVSGGSAGVLADAGATIAGAVTNTGTISGTNPGGVGIGIKASGEIAGGVTNAGQIAGDVAGVSVAGALTDGLSNAGTITGGADGAGVYLFGGTITGGITNAGTIAGGTSGAGIVVNGGTITGGITNAGTITGGAGAAGIIMFGGTITGGITNAGTITGGVGGAGIWLPGGTVTGGITNSGTIAGQAAGIHAGGGATIAGGISNSGIIGGSAAGIRVDIASTVTGDIFNSGTIAGSASGTQTGTVAGIHVSGTVDRIVNSGTIRADSTSTSAGGVFGIYVSGTGTIVDGITNTGLIEGSIRGASSDGIGIVIASGGSIGGSIVNAGTITGIAGIVIDGSTTIGGGITNSGTITGGVYGLAAPGSGTIGGGITNSGTITGVVLGLGTLGGATIGGDITNSGTIGGGLFGALFVGTKVAGNVGNSGVVGGSAAALVVAGSTITGSIVNTGTMIGAVSGGIYVGVASTVSGGITNSGIIVSGNVGILVDASSSVPFVRNLPGGLIDGAVVLLNPATNFTNAGTIALPATTPSTIAGSYMQEATGVLRTRVASDTSYGQLSVTGTVTLPSNAKIDVDVANPAHGFTVSGMQDVIRAGTLVSDGTFAVTDNSTLFDFTAVKDGNTVDLVLRSASPTGVHDAVVADGNTPAVGASQVLDRSIHGNPGSALSLLFAGLVNQRQVSNAVTQTLPMLTGGSMQAGSAILSGINTTIRSRIGGNQGMPSGDQFLGDRSFWLKPFGSRAEQEGRQGVSGFDASVAGLATGFDVRATGSTHLGLAFAYASAGTDSKSAVAPQHMNTDVYQFVGYGSHAFGAGLSLDFQSDTGLNRNRGTRTITFAPATANAEFTGTTFHVGAGLSRAYPVGSATKFIPSLRFDYTTMKERAYAETGAGALNLGVDGRRVDQLIAGVDARLVHNPGERTTLTANLGVGYDVLAERTSITSTFAGEPGAGFTTYGADPTPVVIRGGAGFTYRTLAGMEVTARWDVERRHEFVNQTASMKLRWMF